MSRPAPTYATLDDWIAREALPFSLYSPEAVNAVADTVINSLPSSVEILGFGEALHGGEEILVLRNHFFRRLVEAHGFSAIAIESSYPRGRLVNEYVNGRGAASYDEVQEAGFGHGFGWLETSRELVEWMREYNADSSHSVKLHFYGFDIPGREGGPVSPRETVSFALDYLHSVDPVSGQKHRERIEALLGADADWENPMAWRDQEKSPELLARAAAAADAALELLSELEARRTELVAGSDEHRYGEALQHAVVARRLPDFFDALGRGADYAGSLEVRDAIMADNLSWILERERGRGKVLVFAHNMHLQRGTARWPLGPEMITWQPAGRHLHERLGSGYAVIGTAVGRSEENGIGPPEGGTLEERLTAAAGPVRFVPTHGGRKLPASEIQGLPIRSGSMKNPSYFALTPHSFTDFDWLAFLDSVTYSRGGRPLT